MPLQFIDSVPHKLSALDYLREGNHPILQLIKKQLRYFLVSDSLADQKSNLQGLMEMMRKLDQAMISTYHDPAIKNMQEFKISCLEIKIYLEKLISNLAPRAEFAYLASLSTIYADFYKDFVPRVDGCIEAMQRKLADKLTYKLCTERDRVHADKFLVMPLSHRDVPLLAFTGGLCYGIALTGSYGILRRNSIDQITLAEVLKQGDGNNLSKLYHIHLSQCAFMKADKIDLTAEDMKKLPFIKEFIQGNTEYYTAFESAIEIATKLAELMCLTDDDDQYAFNLSLNPLYDDRNSQKGHSIGFAVKNKNFYMVDANSGIYRIDDVATFKEFVAWYLYRARYSQRYFRYSISNYPQIEHEFPIPGSLLSKCTPNATFRHQRQEYSLYSFVRSRASNLEADIEVATEKALEQIIHVVSRCRLTTSRE
jgi:hypothetical protein